MSVGSPGQDSLYQALVADTATAHLLLFLVVDTNISKHPQIHDQDFKPTSQHTPDLSHIAGQGVAYMLLDNYMKAKSQLLEGLAVAPFHEELQKILRAVLQYLAGSRTASPAPALASATPNKRYEELSCMHAHL